MLRIDPPAGDPTKPSGADENVIYTKGKTTLDKGFDLRDRIYELVGSNNAMSPTAREAIYSNLVSSIGQDKARKLMEHAYIFNSKPDYQKLPIEERIKHFYNIGSNDPDVQQMITSTKNLGYGTGQGFRTSDSQMNQVLAGRIPATDGSALAITPEIPKKVMLKINK